MEQLRRQRFEKQAARVFDRFGQRAIPRHVVHLAAPSDTLDGWLAALRGEEPKPPEPVQPPFIVDSWRLVRKLERGWFDERFDDTHWAYVGSNELTPLDTIWTRELRGRLEARFGPPTRTLNEVDLDQHTRREEYIEFEYWFVLNDSIPIIAMDVNGPFERGLVVAGDQQFRDILVDIKHAFLEKIFESDDVAPYVDYYYHVERGAWYRTGYDGSQYFLEQISRPNLARGRPMLTSDGGP